MSITTFNNFGVGAIAIMSVLEHCNSLSLAKTTLIYPFLSHHELLNYLSHASINIKSSEKLLIDKTTCFSNFNKRYYDSLTTTFNSIQYLYEQSYISVVNGNIELINSLEYAKPMGKRAEKIFKASSNLNYILQEPSDKLFLNLRVEL